MTIRPASPIKSTASNISIERPERSRRRSAGGVQRARRGAGDPADSILERETGFEPATSTLARSHSTTELFPLTRTLTVPHGRVRVQGRRRRSGAFHAQSAAVFLRAGGTELGAASEAWAPVAAPACSAFFNVSIRSRCRSLRFLLIWNRERSPLRLDIIEPFVKETGAADGCDT